jgi:UTP--glucose-1-phosphate uridylyltransferase
MARVNIHVTDQLEQRGLGDAVRHAREFVGDETFLCQLGDAIFSGDADALPARQLIGAHQQLGTSVIGVEEVPPDKVERYGIVGGTEISPGVLKLDTLIEKPAAAQAPSRLAIAARYILTPAIFDALDATPPGKGGEIQLTDAIQTLMEEQEVFGYEFEGTRYDAGTTMGWLKASVEIALTRPDLGTEFRAYLQGLQL